jgi:ATP-dependent Clp protease ATP-binding subunit ClpA
MKISKEVEDILSDMASLAEGYHHEYITPEHLLFVMTYNHCFATSYDSAGGNVDVLRKKLEQYMKKNLEINKDEKAELSSGLNDVLMEAEKQAAASERFKVEITHLLYGLLNQKTCYATYYLLEQNVDPFELMVCMNEYMIEMENQSENDRKNTQAGSNANQSKEQWRDYVVCMNDLVEEQMPLVGREKELNRTLQILCRKYKNNPLHIGEPGVGKTAIAYGVARRINEGNVPERLLNAKMYLLDLGNIIAGTQFRGDFEKRLKMIMEGVKQEKDIILYIDEIHNIVGAGASNGGTLDAANLLKPYLASGEIRFVGATTYEEYKKTFSKNKSLIRRFQNVDIAEPTQEEAIQILEGVRKHYEKYHNIRYSKGTMEYAVELSAKYMNEKFLPDKAIDLIDEAGAYREMHPTEKKIQMVDKKLLEDVVATIGNVPSKHVEVNETKMLADLEEKIGKNVFGQDEAVKELSNAIKFARAGLNDEDKPLASLLFVGPTGVGKTEAAKTLADVMGVKLVRFDMSEYAEKHTVAKLIGSPAGYVGYDEGGILTETIRKTPHCVLLLDEIEKAHPDIFNVLLQVMDYATLTDNQGRKADFRNVVIIMTSNAGASQVGKMLVGFGSEKINKSAIMDEVKRVFQPEFRNRLSRIITFNYVDDQMAQRIVDKQIAQLAKKLEKKKINLKITSSCAEYLKEKGVSHEYGAREISRIINTEIKPLLVDKILFGKLKKGGECVIDYANDKLSC